MIYRYIKTALLAAALSTSNSLLAQYQTKEIQEISAGAYNTPIAQMDAGIRLSTQTQDHPLLPGQYDLNASDRNGFFLLNEREDDFRRIITLDYYDRTTHNYDPIRRTVGRLSPEQPATDNIDTLSLELGVIRKDLDRLDQQSFRALQTESLATLKLTVNGKTCQQTYSDFRFNSAERLYEDRYDSRLESLDLKIHVVCNNRILEGVFFVDYKTDKDSQRSIFDTPPTVIPGFNPKTRNRAFLKVVASGQRYKGLPRFKVISNPKNLTGERGRGVSAPAGQPKTITIDMGNQFDKLNGKKKLFLTYDGANKNRSITIHDIYMEYNGLRYELFDTLAYSTRKGLKGCAKNQLIRENDKAYVRLNCKGKLTIPVQEVLNRWY